MNTMKKVWISKALELTTVMQCAKHLLIFATGVFLMISILLISIGYNILAMMGSFKEFMDSAFWSPPILIIAIGVVMLFVSSLGAVAAAKEHIALTNLYGILMVAVLVVEVIIAAIAFNQREYIRPALIDAMNRTMQEYDNNHFSAHNIDYLQQNLRCCGIFSPNDWNEHWNIFRKNLYIVPQSCWLTSSLQSDDVEHYYNDGCLVRIEYLVAHSTGLIATCTTALSIVQCLAIWCAFAFAKSLRQKKSMLAVHHWSKEQNLKNLLEDGQITPPLSSYKHIEEPEMYVETEPPHYSAVYPNPEKSVSASQ